MANSVLNTFVPFHGNSHDNDHYEETLTSSDEGEDEDVCIAPEKSFNIDTIFSVPESDDEKSSSDVLKPHVVGHTDTKSDTVDSQTDTPATRTPVHDCKPKQSILDRTGRQHDHAEKEEEETRGAEDIMQHSDAVTGEKGDHDQQPFLTDDDLDSLEKTIMTASCSGSQDSGDSEMNAKENAMNLMNEKILLSETSEVCILETKCLLLRGHHACVLQKLTGYRRIPCQKLSFTVFVKHTHGNPILMQILQSHRLSQASEYFYLERRALVKVQLQIQYYGRETFQTSKSFGSITTSGKRSKASRFGFGLEVIDTPGLLDNRSDDSSYTENEILRSAILCSPGFHVALFIMQYGRITKEDELILHTFKKFFGDKVLANAMLVFTGVDTQEDEELLQKDVQELSQKHNVQDSTRLQQELLQCFEFKYFVMRNRGTRRDREMCARQLINTIAKISHNGQKYYTSSIFRHLEDAFMYMVRDDEVSFLLDVCKEQKEFLDEVEILQLLPKVQIDFLSEMLQYSTWLQTYIENGIAWKDILVKLKRGTSAELNLHEIELLKHEQTWRQTGHQCHKTFMDAVCELQMHNEKLFGSRAFIFQKRIVEFEGQFNTKCTQAREAMKCEAETSLKSFLAEQGWEKLISSGLVVAAVGGSVIAFGPLLGTVVGAGVATKVVAFASAAFWGFKKWTQ
ncbi:hypothetical protein FSP39_023575 [Pinctada imbricata]|uniref:AIG1-type G domain-containing protein n=1 Tax=Pinctada imbricata TaxID=66713 RepID=A0AA88XGT8_PINIB|nr:hypothetical protein FSP39_023575 [Pinctada imbricata]